MKKLFSILIIILFTIQIQAQNNGVQAADTLYKITQNDGTILFGYVLEKDPREIRVKTEDGRDVIIPQYVIKKIEQVDLSDYNEQGVYLGEDKFATRYFITTNGLPIKKGEHYIQWNLFGPDVEFAVADNIGVGVMTSWIGLPIVGTFKYSKQLNENTQLAIGALAGSFTYVNPSTGGVLPYASLSFGDRTRNISFSGGYGALFIDGDFDGRALGSIAGMAKITPKLSFVFDSFILLPKSNGIDVFGSPIQSNASALIIPGLRWHQEEGKAIQFGFGGILADGTAIPVPIPVIQWFRSI